MFPFIRLPHCMSLAIVLLCSSAFAEQTLRSQAAAFYVSPGNESESEAATLYDGSLWREVREQLQQSPVRVVLSDGDYSLREPFLRLDNLGHTSNTLTIEAASPGKAVFRVAPEDANNKINAFLIEDSRNIILRGLTFTGPEEAGYMLRFRRCRDVLVEDCDFVDLPGVYYGAAGTAFGGTKRITFRNCKFERVGSWDGAHMIYNAYDVEQIAIRNCRMVDCAGDFVRFRDSTDYGVVSGCHFESTGNYRNAAYPFIAVSLFNDDDPSTAAGGANYEYFGTNFLIHDNVFIFPETQTHGDRNVIQFYHKGFDPPGREHLLSVLDADQITSGDIAVSTAALKSKAGIDVNKIHLYNNKYVNEEIIVSYQSVAAYGATGKGFEGTIDLTGLLQSHSPVEAQIEWSRWEEPK